MSENNEISRRTFIAKGAAAGGAVVLAGAAGSALAGCSSSSSSSSTTASGSSSKPGVGVGTPVRGGALNIGIVAEIDGFYPPNNHWDTNGYLYAQCIYDPLMAIAANGTIQPYLAESCTPNSTYDTYTLTLPRCPPPPPSTTTTTTNPRPILSLYCCTTQVCMCIYLYDNIV